MTLVKLAVRKGSAGESFFFNGPPFDEFVADMIAESRRLRDANRALGRDVHFGLDDVFGPITLASGNVAGERVAGKRGNGYVVSAADAAFQHAATPGRNVLVEAVSLNLARAGVTADAAELYVDDAAGAEFNGSLCVAQMVNRLIETNLRLDLLLKFCVQIDVVPPEGLLDHQQIEVVEFAQQFGVIESIG